MTASQRRTVIVSMAAMGVAVMLVWAATTGPVGVVGESQRKPSDSASVEPPLPRPSETVQPDQEPDAQTGEASKVATWAGDLFTYLALIGGLWFLTMVVRALLLRLARKLPEKQLVVDMDPLPDVEAGRDALSRDRDRHETALAATDIRNGIVACWVLLEESAARAGVARRPAETATEFVVRFLHAIDVDPRPVAVLAGLYHEARFSTHALPEDCRARAEQALAGIHLDLDRSESR